MKRWMLYVAALVGISVLGAFSFKGTDIGKLKPVEAVWLAQEAGVIYLETDTGDTGEGTSMQAALTDMKAAADGTIFLDTADYIIVRQGEEKLLSQLYDLLRPSCKVCTGSQKPDMKTVVSFLKAHEPAMTLGKWQNGVRNLPFLEESQGRFELRG